MTFGIKTKEANGSSCLKIAFAHFDSIYSAIAGSIHAAFWRFRLGYRKCVLALNVAPFLIGRRSIYLSFVYNPFHELNLLCSLRACASQDSTYLVLIIGSNSDPVYLELSASLPGAKIIRWPHMATCVGGWLQWLISALSVSKLADVLIAKSVPYQLPQIHISGITAFYYGDGFGVFPAGGRLWWNPLVKPALLDTSYVTNNYVNASLVTFGFDSFASSHNLQSYLSLARDALQRKALALPSPAVHCLESITDIVVLSQLSSAGRTTLSDECGLYAQYFTDTFSGRGGKVLLLPHPVHSRLFINNLLDSISRNRTFDDVGLSDPALEIILPPNSLIGIQVEVLACLLADLDSSPVFHVFQTSYIILSALFHEIKINFGYSQALINSFFANDAKSIQFQFQSAAIRCASFLKSK